MTVTIQPDIQASLELRVSGTLDIRAAADIADLVDLTAPEPVAIDVTRVRRVTADGLAHVTRTVRHGRRTGRTIVVDASEAPAIVELLLVVAGIATIDGRASAVAA